MNKNFCQRTFKRCTYRKKQSIVRCQAVVQPGDAWIEAWRQESVGGGIAALVTSDIIQKTLSLYCELGKEYWRIINTLKFSHFPNDGAAEQNSFLFFFVFFSVLCVQSNVHGKQTSYHQANSQPHYLYSLFLEVP